MISRATHRSCTCVCVFVRAEGGKKGSRLVTVRSLSYGLGWEVTGSGVEPPKPITGQRRAARGLHVKWAVLRRDKWRKGQQPEPAYSGQIQPAGWSADQTLQNRVSSAQMRCASQEVDESEVTQGPHIVPLTHNHNVDSIPKTEGGDGIIGDHHRLDLDTMGLLFQYVLWIHTDSGEVWGEQTDLLTIGSGDLWKFCSFFFFIISFFIFFFNCDICIHALDCVRAATIENECHNR